MKEKIISKIRIIFYSALVLSLVLNTIVYFWNLYIKKNNNAVSLCVKADLMTVDFNIAADSFTIVDEYIKIFHDKKVSSILFEKISVFELIQDGFITVKNGYEIIDDFRSHGIINPYIYQQLKHKNVLPNYSYIFIHNQEIFAKVYPALQGKLKNYKVEIFQDSKFKYDGDISNNYIIQVNSNKSNYMGLKLFYPEELIKYFYSNNFNIALLDPDYEDLQQVYDFHITAVIANKKSNEISAFKHISPKMLDVAFENNNYFAFKYPSKEKYLAITDTMMKRENILYKTFFNDYYSLLIYTPVKMDKNGLTAELEKISAFAEKNNILIERKEKLQLKELVQSHKLVAIINIILIISFYFVLFFKAEKLMFLGYTGIAAAFALYIFKINLSASPLIIWTMGAIQIIAIQLFFGIIGDKKIENLIKGVILVFVFYYLSVMSTGQYMYALLHLPVIAKNIIVVFQLLSFAFGLYVYRKKFENQILFNAIQIVMLITFVIVIFRHDMGLSNLFINFYNKIVRNIIFVLR